MASLLLRAGEHWHSKLCQAMCFPAATGLVRSPRQLRSLLALSPQAGPRAVAQGLLAQYHGDTGEAFRHFSRALAHGYDSEKFFASLGYFLAYCACPAQNAEAAALMERGGFSDDVYAKKKRLYLDVCLRTGRPGTHEAIDAYLDHIVRPRIRRWGAKPIFFYHMPKCSGTSVVRALGKYFYSNNGHTLLPTYDTPDLLAFVAHQRIDRVPFLSSSHMPAHELWPVPEAAWRFTILRDPVARAISAWRQHYWAARGDYHLRVLQRQGSCWFYWPCRNLTDWAKRTPDSFLKVQLASCATDMSPETARTTLKRMDCTTIYDRDGASLDSLFRTFDLDLTSTDLPGGLNSTGKRPVPSDAEQRHLSAKLADEASVVDAFRPDSYDPDS